MVGWGREGEEEGLQRKREKEESAGGRGGGKGQHQGREMKERGECKGKGRKGRGGESGGVNKWPAGVGRQKLNTIWKTNRPCSPPCSNLLFGARDFKGGLAGGGGRRNSEGEAGRWR